jgi:hypothetical protein
MKQFLVMLIVVAVGPDHSAAMISNELPISYPPAVHSITCEGHTASLSCKSGYIYVYAANYGRTDFDVCPHTLRSNLNCQHPNTLTDVQFACQGRTSCSVSATNGVFGDPCFGTYKYLSVSYFCQPLCSKPVFHRSVVCEHGTNTLSCGSKYIEILQANYGRTEFHPCPHPLRGDLACRSSNSKSIVSNTCSNTHVCYISAKNSVFGDPCGGTYKYLDVVYRCV